jgi:hypothetical protein
MNARPWPPAPESLTIHPADRRNLDEQVPSARVYGEPVPTSTPIIEDPNMMPGTLRVRVDGRDVTCTLDRLPAPRWLICDPVTGWPPGASLLGALLRQRQEAPKRTEDAPVENTP